MRESWMSIGTRAAVSPSPSPSNTKLMSTQRFSVPTARESSPFFAAVAKNECSEVAEKAGALTKKIVEKEEG